MDNKKFYGVTTNITDLQKLYIEASAEGKKPVGLGSGGSLFTHDGTGHSKINVSEAAEILDTTPEEITKWIESNGNYTIPAEENTVTDIEEDDYDFQDDDEDEIEEDEFEEVEDDIDESDGEEEEEPLEEPVTEPKRHHCQACEETLKIVLELRNDIESLSEDIIARLERIEASLILE